MSASDEFPRGITLFSQPGTSVGAQIIFPASPRVSWVLTEIAASFINQGTNNYGGTVIDGDSVPPVYFILFSLVTAPAGGYTAFTGSWSGKLQYPLGFRINIVPNTGGLASVTQNLEATAYPV